MALMTLRATVDCSLTAKKEECFLPKMWALQFLNRYISLTLCTLNKVKARLVLSFQPSSRNISHSWIPWRISPVWRPDGNDEFFCVACFYDLVFQYPKRFKVGVLFAKAGQCWYVSSVSLLLSERGGTLSLLRSTMYHRSKNKSRRFTNWLYQWKRFL